MLGVLTGATLLTMLPRSVSWATALLIACVPVLANFALLPALRRALPVPADGPRPLFARSQAAAAPTAGALQPAPFLALLAVMAGAAIAVSYSTVEQFAVPLRGSRELGLDRAGIARLLMLAAPRCAGRPARHAGGAGRGTARIRSGARARRIRLVAPARGRLRPVRLQHGGVDAADRDPASGDAAGPGGVADRALSSVRRRWDVRGAVRVGTAGREPRRRASRCDDGHRGHDRSSVAHSGSTQRALGLRAVSPVSGYEVRR
jgi:hypothetical protein